MLNTEQVRILYEDHADEVRVVELASSYDGMPGFYHSIETKRVVFEDNKLTLQWQYGTSAPVQCLLTFEEMDRLIEQYNAYCEDYEHTVPTPLSLVLDLDRAAEDLKTFQPQVREKPLCYYTVDTQCPGYDVFFHHEGQPPKRCFEVHSGPFADPAQASQEFVAFYAGPCEYLDERTFMDRFVLSEDLLSPAQPLDTTSSRSEFGFEAFPGF